MDNPNKKHPHDGKRISLQQQHEVQYWTKALDVTPSQLKTAVDAVGDSAQKVREYLGK